MSLEEFEDNTDPATRRYLARRSLMDIGMGIIYLLVGGVIIFANKFRLVVLDNGIVGKIFAGLIILYGTWRIYRGIKKDYINER